MNKIISAVSTSPPTIPRWCASVYVCQTVVGTHNDLSRDLIGASACILLYTVSNWSNCNATSIKINPHIIKTAVWSYIYINIEAHYFTAIRPNDGDYTLHNIFSSTIITFSSSYVRWPRLRDREWKLWYFNRVKMPSLFRFLITIIIISRRYV